MNKENNSVNPKKVEGREKKEQRLTTQKTKRQ